MECWVHHALKWDQATEAIKEEEFWHAATIREAQDQCAAMIREAETCCAAMIKEAETHHATQAYTLEWSHEERIPKMECAALVEEGHDCQAFLEACSAALQACPLKAHGVLMCPLQLLTGNVSLAAMLATTPNQPQWAENHCQQPPHPQCQGCQHHQPKWNGGVNHLTRKQQYLDQKKGKWLV